MRQSTQAGFVSIGSILIRPQNLQQKKDNAYRYICMYTLEEGSLFGFMGPLFGFMGLGFLKGKTSFLKVKLVPSRHQKKKRSVNQIFKWFPKFLEINF